ncbi:unnamed protein product, partial [Ascophyllum nodosum]
ATQELLRARSAQDRRVQEAAARAASELPATMRECFEEIEEFAYGGGGGLTDEDVCALDTMAICGDRVGVVLAFLRRAKFDVREAKESIRRCCAWRRETE